MEHDQDHNRELKRLLLDIPKTLHNEIKVRASKQCSSIKNYVVKALIQQMCKEKEQTK